MARRWNTDGTLNQSWPDEPSGHDDDDDQRPRFLLVQVQIDLRDTGPDEYEEVAGEIGCRVLAELWGRHTR